MQIQQKLLSQKQSHNFVVISAKWANSTNTTVIYFFVHPIHCLWVSLLFFFGGVGIFLKSFNKINNLDLG